MNCTICGLPTGNIVGSVLPQCKCGWRAPQPPIAQRTWQGLTDEEIQECYSEAYKIVQGRRLENAFYKTIEAKLKERNT